MHPLYRISRPIALLAALAAVAGIGLGIAVEATATDEAALASPLAIAAMAASLAGLVGLVVALAGLASGSCLSHGPLGLIGLILALAGGTLTAGSAWAGLVLAPWFVTELPVGMAPPESLAIASTLSYGLLGLGAVLLGISLRRQRLAPGWLVAFFIVAGIICVPPLLPARYTLVVVGVAILMVRRGATEASLGFDRGR
jgi:hypothetical protein